MYCYNKIVPNCFVVAHLLFFKSILSQTPYSISIMFLILGFCRNYTGELEMDLRTTVTAAAYKNRLGERQLCMLS